MVSYVVKTVDITPMRCNVWLVNMALEGNGSVYEHAKGRVVVYIPAAVRNDSQFPFDIGDKVKVRIQGKKLVVEKG